MGHVRQAYLAMVHEFPGGWDAMAAALGKTRPALQNRIYELKGQHMGIHDALMMQQLSGTHHFAASVAQESGGVFVLLPEPATTGREDLLAAFNRLYQELGDLSSRFNAATADGEIDARERLDLTENGHRLHAVLEQLLALSFAVYCK